MLKKLFVSILLILGFVGALMAQTSQENSVNYIELVGPRPYNIVHGDTLWDLNPDQWHQVQAANPKLQATGRISTTKSGLYRIGLVDNEEIFIPEGVTVRIKTAKPIVSSSKKDGSGEAPKTGSSSAVGSTEQTTSGFPWRWTIIVLWIVAGVGYLLYHIRRGRQEIARHHEQNSRIAEAEKRERLLRRTPSEVGPPMVQGGIPQTGGARIENFFTQQAAARFTDLNPNYRGTEVPVQIGPIVHGTMQDEGETRDLNGDWHELRIDAPGRPGYQARFRYPDGTEENMQAFQECMNIVRAGRGMRGFVFTPAGVVEVPPPAAPAPQPAPHPAMRAQAIRAAAMEEGLPTITIGDSVLTLERGFHITLDPNTGKVERISGNAFDLTIKPKPQVATPEVRSIGAGGGN